MKNSPKLLALVALPMMLIGTLVGFALNNNESITKADDHKSFEPATVNAQSLGLLTAKAELGNYQISQKDGTGYLMLTLKAGELEREIEQTRKPLNLTFVIDRSGSMSGEKIESVKDALYKIAPTLSEDNLVAIVDYGSNVEVSYESGRFDQREFLRAVESIQVNGGTYLEGGLRGGISQEIGHKDYFYTPRNLNNYLNKIIVLSDGLANEGISSAEGLGDIAAGASRQGISVSTIGVGLDYDENTMSQIARGGRGNYYFLEDPRDAERIFAEELEKSMRIVASDIKVEFNPNSPFKIKRGVGYELESREGFKPYDLVENSEVKYLFEIELKPEASGYALDEEIELADLSIAFENFASQKQEFNIPVKAQVVTSDVDYLANRNVYKEYVINTAAQKQWEMDKALEAGNNEKAKVLNREILNEITSANESLDGELEVDVQKFNQKQQFLEELGNSYINDSAEGKNFKKENQADSFEQQWQK
jgi:Ca-activated chloride channel family protein